VATPVWYAYVEEHQLADAGRRVEGRDERLARTPDAVLGSPDEVAQWITSEVARHGKGADDHARTLNGLMGDRGSVNRSVASKGGSVYATVHQSATGTIDLCAEIVASDGCSSPRGHNYQKNGKGEWRCANCGQLM
jgi:hypothetical protein